MTGPGSSSAPARSLVRVQGDQGWAVALETMGVPAGGSRATVLTVPASKHERDAWGPMLTSALVERGFSVVSMDVRGRGDSRDPQSMTSLPPGHLRRVAIDVAAAIDHVASAEGGSGQVVVMCEQDTADAAVLASMADLRVVGLVMVTPKIAPATLQRALDRPLAMCVVASKEDHASLESASILYGRSGHVRSRFRLVGDVGSGTTMFAAWQYLRRDERPLEQWLASWVASVFSANETDEPRESSCSTS